MYLILPLVANDPSHLAVATESRRCGTVALTVLNEPIISIFTTVLKALLDRLSMGAIKLPAAPTLSQDLSVLLTKVKDGIYIHHIIDAAKFLDALPNRPLQVFQSPHVNISNAQGNTA